MAIESSFIPFPSEVVIPPAAYMAAATGEMNVFLIVVCATTGALLGALVNYILALYLGRPIIYRFANSRLGHLCLIDEEKVKVAERYFDEHGAIGTIVGRLVPAVRQLISIPAGLAKMRLSRFLIYTAIGAGAWNCILAAIGYTLAFVVPYEELNATVEHYSAYLKALMVLIGIGVVVYLYRQYRK